MIILFFLLSIYFLLPNKTYNINTAPLYNKHLYEYLNTIHSNMYNIKLSIPNVSKMTYENFCMIYLLLLRKITKNEKNILKSSIDKADKLIKLAGLKCLLNIPWKFLISKNNLEMSMPYTIGNNIVIPEKEVSSISSKTLIHEKIHILQRNNQEKFNNYYKKLYPFLFNKINDKIIPNELEKKHMTNPDSNNTYWIYRIHNKLWLPLLICEKQNNCIELAYPVLFINNNVVIDVNNPTKLRNLLPNMEKDISLYHPNEIFACQLASTIINNRPIDTDLYNMLNRLC
jgi:hypothetical protein